MPGDQTPAGSGGLGGPLPDGVPVDDGSLVDALDEVILGGPKRYTRADIAEAGGIEADETRRLWRSLGFADVPDGEVRFTDADLDAARTLARLSDAGVLAPDVREAVARAMAQSASQLAEWQVGMLKRLIEAQGAEPDRQQSVAIADALLPTLEQLQSYVWRRHLAATVARMLVNSVDRTTTADTETLTVGFADMVGFTRTTRRSSVAELSELIERFGAATSEIIAEGGGRIIKMVGDEVLFVADDARAGAEIALGVQERVREERALPQLRIGLAAGPVLVRYGDVYGEVVNIAARLTSNAHADAILVDREVAQALGGTDRFALKPVKAISVRGYRRLHAWALERGAGGAGTDTRGGAVSRRRA